MPQTPASTPIAQPVNLMEMQQKQLLMEMQEMDKQLAQMQAQMSQMQGQLAQRWPERESSEEKGVVQLILHERVVISSQNYPEYKWNVFCDKEVNISSENGAFNIIRGLTAVPGTVSFEDAAQPGHYLRHSGFKMRRHECAS
eukprot:3111699-Prymnesium_polylepis.1